MDAGYRMKWSGVQLYSSAWIAKSRVAEEIHATEPQNIEIAKQDMEFIQFAIKDL